ncbi:hypothetical protein VQ042_22780 [Aurantimonas sp. A2-1-M11]|uniref:hypothetical protein n=1 Tax=Aurantimonas sp. A2-1-M11 TaxID=3113712 RepID=UPI002F92042B
MKNLSRTGLSIVLVEQNIKEPSHDDLSRYRRTGRPLRQRLIDDMSVRRVSAETQRNSHRRFWKNDQDRHRPVIGADVSGR